MEPTDENIICTKKCIACFINKPISNFCRDRYTVGGYKNKCKSCVLNKVPAYQAEENHKICSKCLIEKEYICFNKNKKSADGLSRRCKNCINTEELVLKQANYYLNNIEKIKQQMRENYLLNKEDYIEKVTKYYNDNIENIKIYKKDWANKNKERINANRRDKLASNVLYQLRLSIYANISSHFKRAIQEKKQRKTLDILGCTIEEFKEHIERQFLSWMSWENYGNICTPLSFNCSWDLDHIIPLNSATCMEELYLLNHWSNFQPLCSKINRNIKRDNVYPVTNLELKITKI